MNQLSSRNACPLLLLALLLPGGPAAMAAQRNGSLAVSARVPAITQFSVESQPATLTITKDDIRAGYVDVVCSYEVKSNDRAGYGLAFAVAPGSFNGVQVIGGLANPVTLTPGATTLAPQPYRRFYSTLQVTFHFLLVDKNDKQQDLKIKPGVYPWPVNVSVQPL